MTDTNSIYNQLGVSDKVLRFGKEVLAGLSDQFRHMTRWRSSIRPRLSLPCRKTG